MHRGIACRRRGVVSHGSLVALKKGDHISSAFFFPGIPPRERFCGTCPKTNRLFLEPAGNGAEGVEPDYKYDVAISFLGNDLQLAQELTGLLRDRMTVFLFTERQGEVAGSDGMETLTSVFGGEARLVVVLHRATWGQTPWTRVEETAIKNRGLDHGWDFVLVIPLESSSVPPYIPKTQIWLSYERYGLPTAVAVLERKLEELGGKPQPVTAQTKAEQYKRHVEWKEKAERLRRSQEGVDAAQKHVTTLFAELKQALAAGGGPQFNARTPTAARMWTSQPDGEGSTVTIRWQLQWGNVLDHSGLHVRLWKGYASAAGEDLVTFVEPVELAGHAFDFVYTESEKWMWQHRDTSRTYDTTELASFCVGLLLDHITGN